MTLAHLLLAANAPQQDVTQFLFASDKIYTVLTVVLIIFTGVVSFLLLTNRRISRLEKQLGEGPLPKDGN
jgi:CcmD family protein